MDGVTQAFHIARFDLGVALRTKRALAAAILYGLAAMATGAVLIWIETEVRQQLGKLPAAAGAGLHVGADGLKGVKSLEEVLAFLAGDHAELARHLLQIPLVVTGFFWVTLTFLPFLVALTSFDLVNGELRQRSIRFLLLRCSRGTVLAGKVLAHMALFLVVTVVSNAALFGYAWWQLPDFETGAALLWLARFWGYTVVFGFCYVSLAAAVSAWIEGGGLSLVALIGLLIGLGVLSFHDTLGVLSPSAWKGGLWSPSMADVGMSLAAFVGFGVAFLALAWLRLARRDV